MLKIHKAPIVAGVLFILLFPWMAERLPAIEHYPDLMVFAGIYCIITIGLSLLMGYAGQISLGHAAFFGIGAYMSGILTSQYNINPWICMLAGAILATLVAIAVGAPSLRLRGHYLAMATLAFGIIINIVFREELEWTGGPDGMGGIPGLDLFGYPLESIKQYYYLVWAIVGAAFFCTIRLIQSPTGRALRAIHVSEAAAGAMGVDISKYKVMVFAYSALLASLAGSLYAHYMNFINPSAFDPFFSIKLIIMMALGGAHSIWGCVVGAVLFAFLSFEWLHYFGEFEILVYGGILLLVTVFLPEGLTGLPCKILQRVRR